MSVPDLNSRELLRMYQGGESAAAEALFDRYVARLIALARSRIGPKLKRRVDAEDIVQSAYRSFFLHAKNGEYQLAATGDLWRLLVGITLKKLYGQVERQTAAKRSVHREEQAIISATEATAPEPTPAEVVAVVEQLNRAIDGLSSNEQLVLTSRLQGRTIDEISELLGKSERTTRRVLAAARQKIERRLLSSTSVPPAQPAINEVNAPLRYSDYVLERMLGAGAMGKVFRAREKSTGRIVAIKALQKVRQSDVRAVRRFVQEAQILGSLQHPRIVGVQGLGQFPAGGYFMVMEFVEGTDLQSRLDHDVLPKNEVVGIAKQIATAIQHAHEHGVVHCDLKPANVIVDKNGNVSVTDFGFAFLIVGVSQQSAIGIGGTAGYIAPEVLHEHARPTPAADIFAIGALMWTLATGCLPSHSSLQLSDHGPLEDLRRVCRKCLANDPEKRYHSAQELVADLDRI